MRLIDGDALIAKYERRRKDGAAGGGGRVKNDDYFPHLLLALGALLLTGALLIGACCNLHDAKAEIAAQQERIAELEARPLTIELTREEPQTIHELIERCRKLEEALAEKTAEDKPAWHDAGEFRIYHYCPCEFCCSKDDGITATGTMATEGRTVAVDPDVIPLGSEVLINGVIYIAEDTGVHGKTIDLFINSHAQAAAMGTYLTNVKWREK